MTGAYWEMEQRRLMGSRYREIAGYVALEYPRESVAAVVRMADSPPKPNGRGAREPRPFRAPAPAGSVHGDPCP